MVTEVKIICPQCNGTGNPCSGVKENGDDPDWRDEGSVCHGHCDCSHSEPTYCQGKGYILAQLWEEVDPEDEFYCPICGNPCPPDEYQENGGHTKCAMDQ